MPHWIATGTQTRWQDAAQLRADLQDSAAWRPTARTAITSVLLLEDGRFIAEAQGPVLAEFQDWLSARSCVLESCRQATAVARAGSVWPLKT